MGRGMTETTIKNAIISVPALKIQDLKVRKYKIESLVLQEQKTILLIIGLLRN